jgi:NTP pyrophosphatase (non-canonical NTP hydrolase)
MNNKDWIVGLHLEEQLRDTKVSENQKKFILALNPEPSKSDRLTKRKQMDKSRKTFDHPDSLEITTFDKIAALTKAWAVNKGILAPTPLGLFKQLGKFFEEAGEMSGAVIKMKDMEEVKLEMGDVFVTLVILCAQLGITPEEALSAAYNKISGRKGKTVDGVFIKESDL